MKADIEDPCWTAYILGELSAEEVRQAEGLLSGNPELASQVERLQGTLNILQEEFRASTTPPLEPLRREAVLQEASPANMSTKRIWFPTAAAALFAIGLGIAHWRSLPPAESNVLTDDLAPMELMMDSEEALPSPVLRMEAPMNVSAPMLEEAQMKQKKMEPSRERSVSSASARDLNLQESADGFIANGVESTMYSDELKEEALPLPTPTPTPTPEPEKKPERGF